MKILLANVWILGILNLLKSDKNESTDIHLESGKVESFLMFSPVLDQGI